MIMANSALISAEARILALGVTAASRLFTAAFTVRGNRMAHRVTFPNLRPSTATISLRPPQGLLNELRTLANERDVPYQSLLKVFLAERVAKERDRPRRRARSNA